MEVNGKVMEGRSHRRVRGELRRMFNRRYSVQVVTLEGLWDMTTLNNKNDGFSFTIQLMLAVNTHFLLSRESPEQSSIVILLCFVLVDIYLLTIGMYGGWTPKHPWLALLLTISRPMSTGRCAQYR